MRLARPRYRVVGDQDRFDERDTVQSRNTLEPGTADYEEFYELHPEWRAKDDAIRELPGMGHVGSPLDLPMLGTQHEFLARLGAALARRRRAGRRRAGGTTTTTTAPPVAREPAENPYPAENPPPAAPPRKELRRILGAAPAEQPARTAPRSWADSTAAQSALPSRTARRWSGFPPEK